MSCLSKVIYKLNKLLIAMIMLFISFSALSEVSAANNFFDLSLEELSQVTVSIASRKEEHVNFAAGNVTAYSHHEIKALGGRNLRDVLDRMTSMLVLTSHVFPQHKLSMRGVNTGINDTSVLVLINGNPIKNDNDGGSSSALYNGISLSMIERIEVIRGPGSVLYGSNAFSGVINKVTKASDSEVSNTKVEASVGTFNSKALGVSSQLSGQNHDVFLGVNIKKSDGDTFDNITDEFGNTGLYFSGYKQTTLVASGSIGEFSFTSLYTDFEIANGGGLFKLVEQVYTDEKNILPLDIIKK